MVLGLVVPTLETGKNGHASFSRELYNFYTVFELNKSVNDFLNKWFIENSEGFCYFLVTGLKVLNTLEKSGKVGKVNKEPFTLKKISNNNGVNAEYTVLSMNGFYFSSKDEDKNGIDGFFNDGTPIQIKSVVHGKADEAIYYTIGKKKVGISVINASKKELFDILIR